MLRLSKSLRLGYTYFFQEESLKHNCYNGAHRPCSDEDQIIVLNGAMAGIAALAAPVLDKLEIPEEIENIIIGFFNRTTLELVFYLANHILTVEPYRDEVFKEVSVLELVFDGYPTGANFTLLHAAFNAKVLRAFGISQL